MATLSDRLKELGGEKGRGWQAQLARHCGIKPPSVADWVSGKTKTLEGENLLRAAEFFGVHPRWLATGLGSRYPTTSSEPVEIDLDAHPDLVRIRKVTLRLRAGISGFAVEPDEEDGQPIFFRSSWLADRGFKAANLLAIKVRGASMEPSLYEGDVVVANTADTTPLDGEVFAVNYEGEALIKRLVRDSGSWWLASDNPDQRRYPRKEWVDKASFLIGRIVHKQSERI